ncbi:MAG: PLP-dependent aspartate aminotransferase family protein [Thermoprotei archaeon]
MSKLSRDIEWGFNTKAVHLGQRVDNKYGSIFTPIFMEDAFLNPNKSVGVVVDPLSGEEYIYTRYGNPTITSCEQAIAGLEGGQAALLFSSGMAAISATLFTFLGKGDHVISLRDLYGQTYSLFKNELPRFGVDVSFVSASNIEKVSSLIKPNTKAIYVESITNPVLRVVDLEYLGSIAAQHSVKLIVDSTFATPYNQNPLRFGAHIVIHSATKYLNGYNDLMAGVVISDRDTIIKIRDQRIKTGGNIDPLGAYLLSRGLKTLGLRVERQNTTASKLAEWLEHSPYIKRVYYPGLESHPDYPVAKRVLRGYGGVVSFEIEGGDGAANKFVDSLQLAIKAPSLGGVQTLITVPRETSHHPRTGVTEEELRVLGINPGLIRVAVGIEDLQDLIQDFENAFRVVFK